MADPRGSWLDFCDDAERAFVKRFVLHSGSLKAMAAEYGVSYPTVRLRLDRLIQKIQIVEQTTAENGFERALRVRAADGKVDPAVLGELLRLHREAVDSAGASGPPADEPAADHAPEPVPDPAVKGRKPASSSSSAASSTSSSSAGASGPLS